MHLFDQATIPISEIIVTDRIREELGDIKGLSDSMDGIGIITPVAVRKMAPDEITTDKQYVLLAGERRLRALKARNETMVPACVFPFDLSPRLAIQIERAENLYRAAFTPAEEIKATQAWHNAMVAEHGESRARGNAEEGVEGWRLKDTADLLGVSVAKVHKDLELANAIELLPDLAKATSRAEITKTVNSIIRAVVKDEQADKVAAGLPKEQAEQLERLLACFVEADFFAFAPKIGNGTIHMSEIDPPYAIRLDQVKDTTDYIEVPEAGYPEFMLKLATEVYRVGAENSVHLFWHDPYWEDMVRSTLIGTGFRVKRTKGIWVKNEASNKAPLWNLSQYYEQFFIATKGSPQLQIPGRSALFEFNCVSSGSKVHETERPIGLIEELIETFCPPNGRILVPFLGSGKTLLAAANKKRIAIGCELSKTYKPRFKAQVYGEPYGHYTDGD